MSKAILPAPALARDIVALHDTAGIVRHVSAAVTDALGYAPAELIGTSTLHLVHPDDQAQVKTTFAALCDGPGSGACLECRCRHKDGSWRYLRVNGEYLPAGPMPLLFTMQDVTERRRDDERLRLLESVATHANDAILITEAEPFSLPGPRILYANPAFLKTTGYTLEEILGQTPRMLQGPDTDLKPRETIRKALKRWQPVVVELLNYRKDGTTFWVELSIVPVADSRGWYTHWVSIQRDISDRRKTFDDLRFAKDEAESANRAKSEFLSRTSHELRTPLNGILGFAQILQLDEAAQAHRPIVDDLYDAGRRLLALINEVLDISRVESGGLPLAVSAMALDEIVQDAVSLVAPLAAQRDIVTEMELPTPQLGVLADRQRVGQVLLNLLSNAVKYNRDGGSVSVHATQIGDRVQLSVSDTGPGLTPDQVKRLFTPFDRLGAEHTGVEGTGLGLTLSKRLVEAMGGTMGAESRPGAGSRFWVELPAADALPLERSRLVLSDVTPPPYGPRLVLYVEDNPANMRVVELALAHRPGVKFIAAMQGGLGLELASQHRPDLILLDLHLPDMHGSEVIRRLRDNPVTAATPVVILSADATPLQIARLPELGAIDYLTKPLDIRQFLRVVDAALQTRSIEADELLLAGVDS